MARSNAVIKSFARIVLAIAATAILFAVAVALLIGQRLPAFTPGVVFVAFVYLAKVAGYRPVIPWWLSPERPARSKPS